MGSTFHLILMIFCCVSLSFLGSNAQSIKSAYVLDLLIRDYTIKSLDKNLKTGISESVKLPSNLSDIKVDAVRFRCGSLTRYGAKLKEFQLSIGVTIHPCIERVMLIRQSIGYNWSSIYYDNKLSKYQLVSPILGLLAYNADNDNDDYVNSNSNSNSSSNNPFQLGIEASEKLITIDFKNVTNFEEGIKVTPLCASFEGNGRMTISKPNNPLLPFVCVAKRHGHFGLVIESQPQENEDQLSNKPLSQWKVAVGSTIGAVLAAILLGLLLVAMLVRVKKRSRIVEMERRAYEEEALQVSMVGHVRAPTAPGTRTSPTLEHD